MTQKMTRAEELGVPEDIFQTACAIILEAKSVKSVLRHTDVIDAIAKALASERQGYRSKN